MRQSSLFEYKGYGYSMEAVELAKGYLTQKIYTTINNLLPVDVATKVQVVSEDLVEHISARQIIESVDSMHRDGMEGFCIDRGVERIKLDPK